jgi:hypothetical protein
VIPADLVIVELDPGVDAAEDRVLVEVEARPGGAAADDDEPEGHCRRSYPAARDEIRERGCNVYRDLTASAAPEAGGVVDPCREDFPARAVW